MTNRYEVMSVQEHFRGSSGCFSIYLCVYKCVCIYTPENPVFTSEQVRPAPSDPWETWSRKIIGGCKSEKLICHVTENALITEPWSYSGWKIPWR